MNLEIRVGFGRVDIMPEGSVELGGLGNGSFRKSERVLDTLYATGSAEKMAEHLVEMLRELN